MPRGPRPLHPSVRQRQNKTSTAAELEVLDPEQRAQLPVPELPQTRMWDPRVEAWWIDVHQSPMLHEWDAADHHAVVALAYLLDRFYRYVDSDDSSTSDVVKLHKQFLAGSARLGLDPFARRSLNWMLVQTEKDEAERDLAKERTRRSRSRRRTGGDLDALR